MFQFSGNKKVADAMAFQQMLLVSAVSFFFLDKLEASVFLRYYLSHASP
jgi:uncharacterized membrane protein YwzB